MVPKTKF